MTTRQQRALARLREMAAEIGPMPSGMLAVGRDYVEHCPHEYETPWEIYERRKAELEAACLPADEYEARLAELVEEMKL